MARRNSESGRQAVIWLATAIVVVIGAAATAFVIFAGTDQIEQPLIVWGCFIFWSDFCVAVHEFSLGSTRWPATSLVIVTES